MKGMHPFLKTVFVLILTLSLLLSLFGCTAPEEGNLPSSDLQVSSSDREGSEGTEDPSSSDAPSTGTEEGAKTFGRAKILCKELGLRGATAESSHPEIAGAKAYRDSVIVTGSGTGSAVITVTDYFGFTAQIKVTADAQTETLHCEPVKCTEEFLEVGLDFGAKGNGSTDDTNAFQKALDAAKPGETVYVYPGRYNVSLLTMREGVTLRMYTTMTDASQGLTEQVAKDFKDARIAVLSGTRILNCKNQTAGRNGCSNFKIIGGGFDQNLSDRSCLIFGMAKNVTVENVIFKDIKNNHVIQLTGSSDTVVKNCIFAGFLCGDNFTREIIQVEPSTPAATGGPITFGEGEFALPKNITVTDCYFGKSDKAGPPLIAIGHHSQVGGANVTGFRITNNVFDECLYAAIRYNNLVDVEITGNLFRSTSAYKNATQYAEAVDPAFLHFYHYNKATTYEVEGRGRVTRAAAEEQAGLHNIRIENNVFEIGAGSDKRILSHVTNNTNAPGVFFANHYRQDTYQGEVYTLAGYRETKNYASDLSFSHNEINFLGKPAYSDWHLRFGKVYGLKMEDNKVKLASGVRFTQGDQGQKLYNFGPNEEQRLILSTKSSDRTVTFVCGNQSWVLKPKFLGLCYFRMEEGGVLKSVTYTQKGDATITVAPASGYSFGGLTDSAGTALSSPLDLKTAESYVLKFTK